MSTTPLPLGSARQIVTQPTQLDQSLPEWARRSNPIVRRQLGIYWRVFVPQVDFLAQWYFYQAVIILLTAQFGFLFVPVLMMVMASLILLPIVFWMYGKIISELVADSVRSITDELQNDTLLLLRVTPFTMRQIILSKVAAAFWRQMEPVDGILSLSLFLGTPLILFMQVLRYAPESHFMMAQVMTVVLMLVSLVRLPLEVFMISTIGMAAGAGTRSRSMGIIVAATVTFFYFLLVNLPRLLPLSLPLHLLVEVVLPLTLPLLVIAACLRFALYAVATD